MKKLILLISVLFCFCAAQAQGDLQFNQVINYELQPTTSPDSVVQSIIVPNGKVLKIESITPVFTGGNQVVRLNGARLYSTVNSFPFWLSSGNHTITYLCTIGGCPNEKVIVSAIEFNVTP